jgi:ribosomal-protein-alanine N-acetyltransferase
LVQLKTRRLLIREFTLDDYEGVHAYASDPEVTHFMEWGPNTPEDTRGFLARAVGHQSENPRLNYTLAVEHPEDGVIGGCGVYVTSLQNRSASIGYCLNRGFWGKGYGTEVAGKLIAYGFEALCMHRVTATCDPRNAASWRVMEHNGMRREGLLREDKLMRREWRDSLVYSILRGEYIPHGSRAAAI